MEKPWLAFYEKEVPKTLTYPKESLCQMLEESAAKYPNKTALKLVLRYLGPVRMGGVLTYAQTRDQVNRFAAALYALGVRKGDRIALMLPNLPQFVIAFFGALKLGAIVCNTNPTYTSHEIKHQFADSGAETVVMLSSFYERLKTVQSETKIKRVIIADVPDYVPAPLNVLVKSNVKKHGLMVDVPKGNGVYFFKDLIDQHPEAPPKIEVDSDSPALFQYTGGTTGVPKAAMLTHYNLVANCIQVRNWMVSLQEGNERVMGAIPFFHVYGMTVAMLLSVYLAGELVITPNPRDILAVMNTIQKERCTVFPGVPTMYIAIINHPKVGEYDLKSVKACISGAAPLPMDVQTKFGEITGGRLVEGYGLTEAAPVTHCNPVYGHRKAGSIGVPLADVEARIVDYEKLVDQPVGQDGELWIKGPQVMGGYYNKPDETAKTITEDGWLRTGDIAKMDEDGYFYIVDRLKDIIIASGFNIVPREVEEVLFQHPMVQEAVVAGIPDRYRGETVKAYIVLKVDCACSQDEITKFCAERLAPYKVPKQVEFRSELPKTMVGKFLRRVLVEEERQKLAGDKQEKEIA